MQSLLSQTAEYALRASLYLARHSPRFVPVGEIAAKVDAPRNYLGKILSQLTRAGFLDSNRGAAGGFRLAAPSDRTSLSDIVALIDPPAPRPCLLGLGPCVDNPACAVHRRWAPVAASTAHFFANTTIHDLLHHPEGRTTPPSSGAFTHASPSPEDAP